jgi:hypothetical protein
MDYQVYAYLQLGQDQKAKAIIDEATTIAGFTESAGYFAGALRRGTRRLEGGIGASGAPQPAASGAGDHLFCPCPRRRPFRQS